MIVADQFHEIIVGIVKIEAGVVGRGIYLARDVDAVGRQMLFPKFDVLRLIPNAICIGAEQL